MGELLTFKPKPRPAVQTPAPACSGNDILPGWFDDDDPLFIFTDDANFVPTWPRVWLVPKG